MSGRYFYVAYFIVIDRPTTCRLYVAKKTKIDLRVNVIPIVLPVTKSSVVCFYWWLLRVGPPGEPGATGHTGETGGQGSTGSRGDTGPTGSPGQRGLPGGYGPRGPPGHRGRAGLFMFMLYVTTLLSVSIDSRNV